MATREGVGHLPDRQINLRLIHSLHIDLIDEACEAGLKAVWVVRIRINPIECCLLLTRRRDAKHFALSCTERNHDEIVLIHSESRLPLGGKNADDTQWHTLDLHYGANRVLIGAEKPSSDCLPEHYHESRLVIVLNRDSPPGGDPPISHRRVGLSGVLNRQPSIIICEIQA